MYRLFVQASLMAVMLLVAGCSKNSDSMVDPGNGGNGGNNGGGTVTAEQRRAAVDSVIAFAESLTGSPAQDNVQIVEFARRLSVVEAAGIEGGMRGLGSKTASCC